MELTNVISGEPTVNPGRIQDKALLCINLHLKAGEKKKSELSNRVAARPCLDFDTMFEFRKKNETGRIISKIPKAQQAIASAFSGSLWTKQFYYYDVLGCFKGVDEKSNPQENRFT
jgi:hypothetical protein